MAGWNGSGAFIRLYSWLSDAAAGIDITASRMDADTDAITAQGFANCLTRDGQGSAAANLPMNGFRHTGVSNGVAATDYVALGQLLAPGSTVITPGAYLGEIRRTALPEAMLAALMPGWHICGSQTRPRTDPLWLATGAVSGADWVYGNGDGTTTYNLPDYRGRVGVGKDDMTGTPANRVTNAVSGITGTTLGAVGGDQHAQADTVTTTLSGGVSASSASTSSVGDAGHAHTAPNVLQNTTGPGNLSAGGNVAIASLTTTTVATGVTVGTATTTTITNTLGVSSTSALTGASQNMPPGIIENVVIYTGAV